MADSVRGNSYLQLPIEIQKGILLHRQIDTFTDFHSIYRKSKHRLHPKYGHYSGVIMDIFYDHFLAKNWELYSEIPLNEYAASFYNLLKKNEHLLNESAKKMLPYLIENNWFVMYQTLEDLEKILFQMDYKTKHRVNMHEAIIEIQVYYSEFENEFKLFFDEINIFCKLKINELNELL